MGERSVVGQGVLYGARELPSEARAREILLREDVRELERRFERLDSDSLSDEGKGLVSDERGRLWVRDPGEPRHGRVPEKHAFVVALDSRPVWFSRPDPRRPQTIEELRKREERAAKEAERKQTKTLERRRESARVVVLGDLVRGMPGTLRSALVQLDQLGGHARIADGRLLVELPPSQLGQHEFGAKRGTKLATYLYRAESALVETMRGKDGPIDATQVPDRAITPAGALVPGP